MPQMQNYFNAPAFFKYYRFFTINFLLPIASIKNSIVFLR